MFLTQYSYETKNRLKILDYLLWQLVEFDVHLLLELAWTYARTGSCMPFTNLKNFW